ncbi:MAG: hypothetical protein ACR2RD_15035, partial [Woeseiaceae bacterium]
AEKVQQSCEMGDRLQGSSSLLDPPFVGLLETVGEVEDLATKEGVENGEQEDHRTDEVERVGIHPAAQALEYTPPGVVVALKIPWEHVAFRI